MPVAFHDQRSAKLLLFSSFGCWSTSAVRTSLSNTLMGTHAGGDAWHPRGVRRSVDDGGGAVTMERGCHGVYA